MEAIRSAGDGVRLTVQVQPRAKATEWAGPHGDALRVRVAAPPVGGKANKALVEFVAASFGVPKKAVTIVQGEKDRRKVLEVEGVTVEEVRASLGSQMELL